MSQPRFKSSFLKLSAKNKTFNTEVFDGVTGRLRTYLQSVRNKNAGKVIDFKTPDELYKIMDFKIRPNKPASNEEILSYCDNVIKYSVRASHNNYHNSLFGGFHEAALAGDYIVSTINGSVYTYELAPMFTLMEEEIAKALAQILGWSTHDYMFAAGGSAANLYGLTMARHHKYPKLRDEGSTKYPVLKVFTSEVSHYSISKAAIMMGIGTNNVVKVKTCRKAKMVPEELEKAIAESTKDGSEPMMINSTVGTTVMGAVDDISAIDKIAKKHKIWHHVDACFGGVLIFPEEERAKLLPGLTTIDSIAFDPHKVMNVPQQCSIYMTRHQDLLRTGNSTFASYLFMKDKALYDANLDKGDKSFQCGRHVDVLKLWLYWQALSTAGLTDEIRSTLANARYLADLAKKHPNFELVIEPEMTTVGFFYIPNKLVGKTRDEAFWNEVGRLAPLIKKNMILRGNLMSAYQVMEYADLKLVNYFRPAIMAGKDKEDMDFIIQEIHDIGKDM